MNRSVPAAAEERFRIERTRRPMGGWIRFAMPVAQIFAVSLLAAHALPASAVTAYFGPLSITPTEPRAGETVSLNIITGFCAGISEAPGYPLISRNGNSIVITEYALEGYGDLCTFPPEVLTVEPFGSFDPGDYEVTLNIDYRYVNGSPLMSAVVGSVSFEVTGAEPVAVAVPATRSSAAIALILALLGLASRGLSTRSGETGGESGIRTREAV